MVNIESLFLKSLVTLENPFNSIESIFDWIKERNLEVEVSIESIPFKKLEKWSFDEESLNLAHISKKFFSIDGLKIKRGSDSSIQWCQPIINQPEVGYLGIIAKEFDGVLYFLVQAKIEPGNVNCVQLSPTLQATQSNYTKAHAGKAPHYLEYFQRAKRSQILVDQLQSEQGARFLRKRNRNIIILVDEEIPVYEDFRWLTLGQIKHLMLHDNIVNMDTRTVISSITFGNQSLIREQESYKYSDFGHELFLSSMATSGINSLGNIFSWLCDLKSKFNLRIDHIALRDVEDWVITDNEIRHKDDKYFKIIGVNVSISNREVANWCQPMVKPMEEGICVFFIKKIYGVYHFLVQAKFECGNFDFYEFAPTIQCLISELENSSGSKSIFIEEFLKAEKENILVDTFQSEEGGRFYKEQNRNMLIRVDENFGEILPENYCWMTLGQLNIFLKYNNYVNIQARSILSALQYV